MSQNGKAPWADCENREKAYRRGQADLAEKIGRRTARIEEILARLWVRWLRGALSKDDHNGA